MPIKEVIKTDETNQWRLSRREFCIVSSATTAVSLADTVLPPLEGPLGTDIEEKTSEVVYLMTEVAKWLFKRYPSSINSPQMDNRSYPPYRLARELLRTPFNNEIQNPKDIPDWLSPTPPNPVFKGREPKINAQPRTEIQYAIYSLVEDYLRILLPTQDKERIKEVSFSSFAQSIAGKLTLPVDDIQKRSDLTILGIRSLLNPMLWASQPALTLERSLEKTTKFTLGMHNGTLIQIMEHDRLLLECIRANSEVFNRRFYAQNAQKYQTVLIQGGTMGMYDLLQLWSSWLITDVLVPPSKQEGDKGIILDTTYQNPPVREMAKRTLNFALNGSRSPFNPISEDQIAAVQDKLDMANQAFYYAILAVNPAKWYIT
jgi:hypothetical protein